MGRILFLSIAAFVALRYIQNSNKKQQKMLEDEARARLNAPSTEPLGPASEKN